MAEIDDAMAQAVDIGENDVRFFHFLVLAQDFSPFSFSLQVGYAFFSVFWRQDEGEDSEDEGAAAGEEDEKITRNWSIMKSNPPELRKSKVIQNFLYFTVVHILIFKAR